MSLQISNLIKLNRKDTLKDMLGAHPTVANEPLEDGQFPLHLAADLGNADAVALLLKAGAKVDAQDVSSSTALHKAAEKQHTDVVRMLLDGGADTNIRDGSGLSAMFHAANGPAEALFYDRSQIQHIRSLRAGPYRTGPEHASSST